MCSKHRPVFSSHSLSVTLSVSACLYLNTAMPVEPLISNWKTTIICPTRTMENNPASAAKDATYTRHLGTQRNNKTQNLNTCAPRAVAAHIPILPRLILVSTLRIRGDTSHIRQPIKRQNQMTSSHSPTTTLPQKTMNKKTTPG